MATLLMRNLPNSMATHRKELIKFGWNHLKREESSNKYHAFLNVCHFLEAYQAPEKIVLQVSCAKRVAFQRGQPGACFPDTNMFRPRFYLPLLSSAALLVSACTWHSARSRISGKHGFCIILYREVTTPATAAVLKVTVPAVKAAQSPKSHLQCCCAHHRSLLRCCASASQMGAGLSYGRPWMC